MLDQEGIRNAFWLARRGDAASLSRLDLTGFSDPRLAADATGATIVHHAARSDGVDAVKLLVAERGLPGSGRSLVGATPAHDAAAAGCLRTLQWLLDHTDCTVTDADDSGATVTHLAARYGHLLVLKWLVTSAAASLTLTTDAGALPIHFAAARGDLDTVKFLVEQKPKTVNSQMSCGSTACYLSAQGGHLEVLKYLVEEGGASLRILSYDGMSCLHAAAQTGKLDTVKWLVEEHKLSPNERDFDGATTVHFAAGRGHPAVLDWLLRNGAKLVVDNLGGSPLHDAAEHGRLHCVRLLLKNGCDPELKDNNGLTAADLAENCWHRECAATLRRRLTKGVDGQFVPASRERASILNFFNNGNTTIPSDSDGSGSDYLDLDNGSISSSFYLAHSQLWRAPAGVSARTFNTETGELTDSGSTPSSSGYQRPPGAGPGPRAEKGAGPGVASGVVPPGYLTIPPPPSSPPPPVPEKKHARRSGGRLFPGKKRLPDYENIDPSLQVPRAQLNNRNKPVLSRYQPGSGGGLQVNDENGEPLYVRMGPGVESLTGTESGSDLHVITEETCTEPNTPDTKDAPVDLSGPVAVPEVSTELAPEIPLAPPPPPIGSRSPSSTLSRSTSSIPTAAPPPESGHSSRASSFSTSSMPRNINLAELKAKFSGGLRPTLRPSVASSGQPTPPNVDLIAELKSANWTASLKKTKKKKPVEEENKENEEAESVEPKHFWKDMQKKALSPRKTPSKRDRSPSERLVAEYDPQRFIHQVATEDASGNELPAWKRLLIARQLAEKKLEEDEERTRKEEEERRFKDMPGWKRAILEKKEAENRAKKEKEEQDIAAIEWAKRNPGEESYGTRDGPMFLDEDGLPVTPWQHTETREASRMRERVRENATSGAETREARKNSKNTEEKS